MDCNPVPPCAVIDSDLAFAEQLQDLGTLALFISHTLRQAHQTPPSDGATALAAWIRCHLTSGTVTVEHRRVIWQDGPARAEGALGDLAHAFVCAFDAGQFAGLFGWTLPTSSPLPARAARPRIS